VRASEEACEHQEKHDEKASQRKGPGQRCCEAALVDVPPVDWVPWIRLIAREQELTVQRRGRGHSFGRAPHGSAHGSTPMDEPVGT